MNGTPFATLHPSASDYRKPKPSGVCNMESERNGFFNFISDTESNGVAITEPPQAERINKSQAVRDELMRNPKMKCAQIVELLASKGIKVSGNLVYLIKSKAKQRAKMIRHERYVAQTREAKMTMPQTDAIRLIVGVRSLSNEAGGIRHLKQLVDSMAK